MTNVTQPDMEEESRKGFITKLLGEQYGRQVATMDKLGEDSNNFVYLVGLTLFGDKPPLVENHKKPGCTTLPASVASVVIRISNPRAMLDNNVRVQNEVAALQLGRAALASYPKAIVPEVYGWSPTSGHGYGWILEEAMAGKPLGTAFDSLSSADQGILVAQMASILNLIQEFPIPPSLKTYGGLSYDHDGLVVGGPLTFGFGGPYSTLEGMYRGTMSKQIEFCDASELLGGWRSSDLRSRLDAFLAGDRISDIIRNVPDQRLTLIHGDFDIHNMLFDPASLQITALLDFDFAHVACPLDEYFYSLQIVHGLLPSPLADEGANVEILRRFLLGEETTLPGTSEDVNWTLAKRLQDELGRASVIQPTSFGKESADDIGELAALFWFIQEVCPPYLVTTRWTATMTPEQLEKVTTRVRGTLEKYLDRWGY